MIAEVSFPTALTTLHEKAIYLHEARQYQVERFDYDERKAYVRRVDCDYFTDAIDYTQVKELEEFESRGARTARAPLHGDVRVNRQIVGFKKIKFYTMENVGAGNLSMPEQEMHTTAFWLHFPDAFLARFPDLTPTEKQSGLAGLGNALRTVAALLLMCDPRDLGVAIGTSRGQSLRAESVSLRQLSRRHRPERAAVSNWPSGCWRRRRSCSRPAHARPAARRAWARSARWASGGRRRRCGFLAA